MSSGPAGSDEAQPIWARPAPGERRPAHTREEIARAAIAVADAEGFEAVSMRRIAAELGAGTMTLYHYVRTKDELVALMDDLLMDELVIPDDELPGGWREGLAAIARRTHDAFARHPWSFDHMRSAESGPNALRHVEQSLAVAARTGLDDVVQVELTALVDDYVFGHLARTNASRQAVGTGDRAKQRLEGIADYLEAELETGRYPHLQALAGDDVHVGIERVVRLSEDEGRFERGLQRLLDGIELDVKRRRRAVRGRGRGG